jgi:F420-non-reducing hydrogenase large subunit
MGFRAYDPCHGCGTHCLPGEMPIIVNIYSPDGSLHQQFRRDGVR